MNRQVLVWLTVGLSLSLAQTGPSLRELAQARHLLIGAAVGSALYDPSEPEYSAILAREFNFVTPENAMKWGNLSPQQGVYNFQAADQIVQFAQKNSQKVRGHTLVWYQQMPNWLVAGKFSRAELLKILEHHIKTVVGHYKGQIAAWDVVNEAVNDDGSLRENLFLRTIGPQYIELAFRWAHQADPGAKLFYNDYSAEGLNDKSDAIYTLVKSLKAKGAPIDGVGLQTHVDITFDAKALGVSQNIARLGKLGLEVNITEMDVGLRGSSSRAELLQAQAKVYADMLGICLAAPNCTAFTLWGFTDASSWRASSEPLIFDVAYDPKPAYTALQRALQSK